MSRELRWAARGAAVLGLSLAVLLAGCSHPPQPAAAPSTRLSPAKMIAAIQSARAEDKSVIEVTPLRDPAVDGFLDRARVDQSAGKYSAALDKINSALKLSPDAPDILQFRAEIEILLHDFPAADADARRSFALGSKLGGLCAANWQTVLEIAENDNDQATIRTASAARKACHKPGPIRM